MMMHQGLGWWLLCLLSAASGETPGEILDEIVLSARVLPGVLVESKKPAEKVTVRGRVVDEAGRPVAGARVGTRWKVVQGRAGVQVDREVITDASGRFKLPKVKAVDGSSRLQPILALSPDGAAGALLAGRSGRDEAPVEVRLGPLVRVRCPIESERADFALAKARASLDLDDAMSGWPIFEWVSGDPAEYFLAKSGPPPVLEMRLLPGRYRLSCHPGFESTTHEGRTIPVEVAADPTGRALELPPVRLPLTPLGLLMGEEAPAFQLRAVRGNDSRVIRLAEYRGRWVALHFWDATYTDAMAKLNLERLIRLLDDHADDRNRFAVLTINTGGVGDLAAVEGWLRSFEEQWCAGRPLPFPVLVDGRGETARAYRIGENLDQIVLIDPAGRVVRGDLDRLEAALPEVPAPVRAARALDRPTDFSLIAPPDGLPLGSILDRLGEVADVPIRHDPIAWQARGVDEWTQVAFAVPCFRISLRTALRLVLEPLGLAAVPTADGLLVTFPPAEPPRPLAPGDPEAARNLQERLARCLDRKVKVEGNAQPLWEVIAQLGFRHQVPVVLDPVQVRSGLIDPQTLVTCQINEVPLREALPALLGPLGLVVVPRDETLIVRRQLKP